MRNIIALLFLTLLLIGCGSDDEDNTQPTPPPLKFEDPTETIGIGIANLMVDLHNINISGRTCGDFEVPTLCPNGGTVLIKGKDDCSMSGDSRTTNNNFTFIMAECSGTHNESTVTITGMVLSQGTVTDISGIVISQSLQYAAVVKAEISAFGTYIEDFNDDCTFAVMLRKANVTSDVTTSGNVCKKTF